MRLNGTPNKPEFFIIGAPKCGTTTLYAWLKQHPQIFMPNAKEPHYFAPHLSDRYCRMRDLKTYEALFEGASEGQLCGEASVLYGFYPESNKAILDYNPKAKFIFMLRHPIDMAVSYHGQLLVNLEEDQRDFETAWGLQESRGQGTDLPTTSSDLDLLRYREKCALGAHLEAFMALVPAAQRHVILLDDMGRAPQETIKGVFQFLDVHDFMPDFKKENEASAVRFTILERAKRSQHIVMRALKKFIHLSGLKPFIQNVNQSKRKVKTLSPALLSSLYEVFDNDIAILEKHFEKKIKTNYER